LATYYVDATNGDDSNDGLSEANAWKTISKVNSSSFNAGDSILFKRGEVWREQLTVPSSGSSGNPITFGAYGSGADPIINGADLVTEWTEESTSWSEIWSLAVVGNASSELEQNKRWIISNGDISDDATTIRVTFHAKSDAALTIDGASIGERDGSSDDFATTPTRITFDDGNHTVTIPAGTTKVSDAITFTIDESKDYLIHTWHDEGHANFRAVFNGNHYYNQCTGIDDTMTQTVSYSTANWRGCVTKIEKTSAVVENVWSATLTTEPHQVFFDGVRGNKQSSMDDVDSQYDWYWDSNTLYVYSTSDPNTVYTNPGIEASVRNYCITGTTKIYITIDGIDIKYSNLNGIGAFTNSTNWTIQNIDASYNYGAGIQIGEGGDNVYIDSCTSAYNYSDGIGIGGTVDTAVDSVTITGCTLNNNLWRTGAGGAGIWAFNMNNSTISNNTIHSNESGGIRLDGGTTYGCDNNTIIQNTIYSNGRASSPGQGNIQLEYSQNNAITRNNCYTPVESSNIIIAFARSTGNVITYNVIRDTNRSDCAGIKVQSGATDVDIYNNVIYNNTDYGIYLDGGQDYNIKNNIVDNSNSYDLLLTTAAYTNLVCDYNCFTGDGTAPIREFGVANYTVAQHCSSKSQDCHSITSDPLFIDADNGDFHLQAGSPCINAGTDVGLSEDYEGTSVPQGSAPDIGAYEKIVTKYNSLFFGQNF